MAVPKMPLTPSGCSSGLSCRIADGLEPPVGYVAKPAGVEHEQLHAHVGGHVDLLAQLPGRHLQVARVPALVDLHQVGFAGRLAGDHAAALVGVQGLHAGVKIAEEKAEVDGGGNGGFAGLQHPERGLAGHAETGRTGGPRRAAAGGGPARRR